MTIQRTSTERFHQTVDRLRVPGMGTEVVAPWLASMVRFLRPRRVLEVGMGYTTPWLAAALEDVAEEVRHESAALAGKTRPYLAAGAELDDAWLHDEPPLVTPTYYLQPYEPALVAVDNLSIAESSATRVQEALRQLGLDHRVTVVNADLRDCLDKLPAAATPIDLAWVDAWECLYFFDHFWELVNPDGGVVIMHYLQTYPEGEAILRYIAEFQRAHPGELEILNLLEPHKLTQNSLTVLRRTGGALPRRYARPGGRLTYDGQLRDDAATHAELDAELAAADPCLHDLVSARAAATPDAVAVEYAGTELTYAQLDARANQVAHYLVGLGVGPGSLVAVHLERSPELLAALLGVLKTGAGYVPIDVATPRRRVEFIVEETRSPVVLTRQLVAGLTDLPTHSPGARGVATDPAYVMYTSGTTGVPNGVVVPHRALLNYLRWAVDAYDLGSGTGSLVHSSIAFDLTVTTLLGPLLAGQRVILLPESDGVAGLAAALRTRDDLTLVKLTPTHLKVLALLLTPAEVAGRVRTLVVGGEDLWAETLELFRDAGTRIVNEYGPTETVVGCCVYEVGADDPRTGRVPIGRPIANTAIDVVDASLRPVAPGERGEALIRGAGVTAGYLDRPDVTAARFVAGAYRSGDVVRQRPDGALEYLGRRDDQVKIRGVRVELGEIEGVLRQHPGVAEATVVVRRQHTSAPVDDVRAIAYVVAAPGSVPTAEELAWHCRERLPEFSRPEAFVVIDELPTTTNGKLDRSALS